MLTLTMPDGTVHAGIQERKRYNRGNLSDTLAAAATVAAERDTTYYVFPTALGLRIQTTMPGWLKGYSVSPTGEVRRVGSWAI